MSIIYWQCPEPTEKLFEQENWWEIWQEIMKRDIRKRLKRVFATKPRELRRIDFMSDDIVEITCAGALYSPPDTSCRFILDGKDIAMLDWGSGVMKFKGDADESAKIFFEILKGYIDAYIKAGKE